GRAGRRGLSHIAEERERFGIAADDDAVTFARETGGRRLDANVAVDALPVDVAAVRHRRLRLKIDFRHAYFEPALCRDRRYADGGGAGFHLRALLRIPDRRR